MDNGHQICIVGGGAAGTFAAIAAAEHAASLGKKPKILLYEASKRMLQKVRISGGGRCNVTHHDFEIRSFCTRYPRGQKEVLSPMHRFQAKDLVAWFENQGVKLKTESDGRMFPTTDDSETIIGCLLQRARALGVDVQTQKSIHSVESKDKGFALFTNQAQPIFASQVLMATGSNPRGYEIAASLGHRIEPIAPSLFSFKINHPILNDLQGVSFEGARIDMNVAGTKFSQTGPLLITHWGLSGPCVLVLSAWAAREMKQSKYQTTITVNWVGQPVHEIEKMLLNIKASQKNQRIKNACLDGFNKRLWGKLISDVADLPMQEIPNKRLIKLAMDLTQMELKVMGKNRFKEEFVECGGVSLKEIDMKSMQSKVVPGLYFAGELMDVDGVTGGFNLQHAWTSGFVAGRHMVENA